MVPMVRNDGKSLLMSLISSCRTLSKFFSIRGMSFSNESTNAMALMDLSPCVPTTDTNPTGELGLLLLERVRSELPTL